MKKLLAVWLLVVAMMPLMANHAYAQNVEVEKMRTAIKKYEKEDQQSMEALWLNGVDKTQVAWLWNIIGGRPQLDASGEFAYSQGMVGNMTTAIALMYDHPPATTERYVADVLNSAGFKLAQPAFAQGLGFASLDPILSTWKTFRNLAYLFFVVIFLVIGILIMLRQKVGQTAITAQQAIPQIIIALLMVTFSYALAGLLIDAMYLVMYLLLALFNKKAELFLDHNFLSLGWAMILSGAGNAQVAVEQFVGTVMNPNWQWLDKSISSLTLALVIGLAIALQIFKLFFELLKTYVAIVLNIAFAPILLMFGAIPGQNVFMKWIKNLVGNLAAFPIVLGVLIVFDMLTQGGFVRSISTAGASGAAQQLAENATGGGFMPPYLLNTGHGFSGVMGFMVGLGMLLIMPELVKQGKKAAGATEGIFDQFAKDIGESAKRGWTGGELVPGMAMTDTSKWWGGGLSGKNFARKAAIGMADIAGYPVGAVEGYRKRHDDSEELGTTIKARRRIIREKLGDILGDKQINSEESSKTQQPKPDDHS